MARMEEVASLGANSIHSYPNYENGNVTSENNQNSHNLTRPIMEETASLGGVSINSWTSQDLTSQTNQNNNSDTLTRPIMEETSQLRGVSINSWTSQDFTSQTNQNKNSDTLTRPIMEETSQLRGVSIDSWTSQDFTSQIMEETASIRALSIRTWSSLEYNPIYYNPNFVPAEYESQDIRTTQSQIELQRLLNTQVYGVQTVTEVLYEAMDTVEHRISEDEMEVDPFPAGHTQLLSDALDKAEAGPSTWKY